MTNTTQKEISTTTHTQAKPGRFEVMGAKGAARFRMAPLDIQRVTDLFAANDEMMAMQIAA